MQKLLDQYKLAKNGNEDAIRFIISNMGDGKILKTAPSLLLEWRILLARQANEEAYNELFSIIEMSFDNGNLYVEPDYKKESSSKMDDASIMAEAKAWKEQMMAKKAAEEKAKKESEEKARKAELRRIEEEKAAEERARFAAIEEERRVEELRQKEEEARKRKEEEDKRKAEEKEAKRLAKIEAEEKARQLQEQKELELVEHLKGTAIKTVRNIVRDMVFIEGGKALLGNVNNSSNPTHVENIESFWIKKHSITKDEMENLLVEYSISSDNTSKFVQRLSKVTDCTFDIPTSAQLEYAMKAKDKNYVPTSPFSQIGDDRIINYGSLSEIVKDSKVLVVKDFYKLVFSLESKTSADSFRIVCSDAKFHNIKEELVRIEEEYNKS